MANLTESPVYESGVFRLETTTQVKGGPPVIVAGEPTDGFSNVQAQQLANRTAYLKDVVDDLAVEKEQVLTAGTGISINRSNPSSPVISVTSGGVTSVDGQTGNVDLSGVYAPLSHVGSRGSAHTNATTTEAGFMSSSDKSKLNGIEVGATANQADAYLLDRTNHTGTQDISTIDGLQVALDDKEYVLTAGTNVTIDRTDPFNPIISASISGGGGGDVVGPPSSVNNDVALFDGITGKLIKSGGQLGSAAFTSFADYATAAQGALADTALQPEDIGVTVQETLVSGTNIKTVNGQSILGAGDISIPQYNYITTATSVTADSKDWIILTANSQTITLPPSPGQGDDVVISVGNFLNTSVDGGLETITDRSDIATINQAYATVRFTYDGNTWRYN